MKIENLENIDQFILKCQKKGLNINSINEEFLKIEGLSIIDKIVYYLRIGFDDQAFSLMSQLDVNTYINSLYPFLRELSIKDKIFNDLIISYFNNESMAFLALRGNSFFDGYVNDVLIDKIKDLSNTDKIFLVKNKIGIEGKIFLNYINREFDEESSSILKLCKEISLSVRFSDELESFLSLGLDSKVEICLNESSLLLGISPKEEIKMKTLSERISDKIRMMAINLYTNPTVHKLAIGSVALGISLSSGGAFAGEGLNNVEIVDKMSDFVDSIFLGIEEIDPTGACHLSAEIQSTGVNLEIAQYKIVASIGESGSSSLSTISEVPRLGCNIDFKDAEKILSKLNVFAGEGIYKK